MPGIRKFVGYTGAAAGIGAALALALSSSAGHAAAPANISTQPSRFEFTPGVACTTALQTIKTWFANDAAEDNAERLAARMDPSVTETPDQNATEAAQVQALLSDARTACAPTTTAQTFVKPALSLQCTAAIAALKAAWAQGRPTTLAQWQNLQKLAQDVRTACGFTWSGGR